MVHFIQPLNLDQLMYSSCASSPIWARKGFEFRNIYQQLSFVFIVFFQYCCKPHEFKKSYILQIKILNCDFKKHEYSWLINILEILIFSIFYMLKHELLYIIWDDNLKCKSKLIIYDWPIPLTFILFISYIVNHKVPYY